MSGDSNGFFFFRVLDLRLLDQRSNWYFETRSGEGQNSMVKG